MKGFERYYDRNGFNASTGIFIKMSLCPASSIHTGDTVFCKHAL